VTLETTEKCAIRNRLQAIGVVEDKLYVKVKAACRQNYKRQDTYVRRGKRDTERSSSRYKDKFNF